MTNKRTEISEMGIFQSLKEVIDPELYVNIVDLGLVYGVKWDKEKQNVTVEMTLTSKGCPMGDAITQDVEQTLMRLYPGISVLVVIVWEPAWSMDFVTEEGHAKLNGF